MNWGIAGLPSRAIFWDTCLNFSITIVFKKLSKSFGWEGNQVTARRLGNQDIMDIQ